MKNVSKLFVALVAALVMTGCAEKKRTDVLGGEWHVVSVGELAVPDSVGAFLGFDIPNQLVYGSTGCNQLTGTLPVEVDAGTLLFPALGSTHMLCADMTIENALMLALTRVVDFTVDGDSLYLLDASGSPAVTLVKR